MSPCTYTFDANRWNFLYSLQEPFYRQKFSEHVVGNGFAEVQRVRAMGPFYIAGQPGGGKPEIQSTCNFFILKVIYTY